MKDKGKVTDEVRAKVVCLTLDIMQRLRKAGITMLMLRKALGLTAQALYAWERGVCLGQSIIPTKRNFILMTWIANAPEDYRTTVLVITYLATVERASGNLEQLGCLYRKKLEMLKWEFPKLMPPFKLSLIDLDFTNIPKIKNYSLKLKGDNWEDILNTF